MHAHRVAETRAADAGAARAGAPATPKRLLAALALVVIGGMWVYTAWTVHDLRRQAWATARHDALGLLGTSERAISRDIELYDLSLQTVASRLNLPALAGASSDLRQLALFDRVSQARGYGAILVLDETGKAFLDSGSLIPRRVDGSDRLYFTIHRDNPEVGLFIGRPWRTRLSGREMIPLSRRFTYADGSFAGVIVGAIEFAYLREVFDRLKGNSAFTVSLDFTDGRALMNTGEAAASDAEGLREERQVAPWPLRLSVFLPVSAIDAAWRPQTRFVLALALILSLAVLGVVGLLHREFNRRERAERQALAARAELERLAATDALTGLWNRRQFERAVARCADPAERARWALLSIDTDHFKGFNDRYGHPAGDRALKRVAAVLSERAAQAGGSAFRVGGEEFALLVPGEPGEAAMLAESVRAAVAGLALPHADHPRGILTLSVGVAHGGLAPAASLQDWIDGADAALYAAKRQGRDRVCRAGAPDPVPPARLAAAG